MTISNLYLSLNLATQSLATTLLAFLPPSLYLLSLPTLITYSHYLLSLSNVEFSHPDSLFVLHSYKNLILKCTLELGK